MPSALDTIIDTLLTFDQVYLATPYTKYPWGIDAAAYDAAKVAGRLMNMGVHVFSPIVHAHAVSAAAGIDPVDHAFWMNIDVAHMNKSDALLVCRMTGWQDSQGVNMEIKEFTRVQKPIFFMDPGLTR